MKNPGITILFLLLLSNLHAQNFKPCSFLDQPANPVSIPENFAEGNADVRAILTIPVVVHVIWHTTTENIFSATIAAQFDFSGKDYRRLNTDTINTPPAFQSVAADAEIEFCLATIDPSGNPTSGITRTYTDSLTFVAGPGIGNSMKHSSSGGIDAWDTHNYLNIWIVNLSNASGFASNPMQHGSADDGIVMNYTNINNTHLMSHEIGHYLDLMHIYGMESASCQTMDGGDGVSDTPDQAWSTFGCPSFPQTDSCTTTAPGIMFMNFMDQTSSACQNLFTQGQVTRMRNALSSTRASLLSSNGCVTGINEATINHGQLMITISPNPVISEFKIEDSKFEIGEEGEVEIRDLLGRVVLTQSARLNTQYNISSLPAGIYFVELKTNDGIAAAKFVKE